MCVVYPLVPQSHTWLGASLGARCADSGPPRSPSQRRGRGLVLTTHRVPFDLGVLPEPPEDPRHRPGLTGRCSSVPESLPAVSWTTAPNEPPRTRPPPSRPPQPPGRLRPVPGLLRPARPRLACSGAHHRGVAGHARPGPSRGRHQAFPRAIAAARPGLHRAPVPDRQRRLGMAHQRRPRRLIFPATFPPAAPAAALPSPDADRRRLDTLEHLSATGLPARPHPSPSPRKCTPDAEPSPWVSRLAVQVVGRRPVR